MDGSGRDLALFGPLGGLNSGFDPGGPWFLSGRWAPAGLRCNGGLGRRRPGWLGLGLGRRVFLADIPLSLVIFVWRIVMAMVGP